MDKTQKEGGDKKGEICNVVYHHDFAIHCSILAKI